MQKTGFFLFAATLLLTSFAAQADCWKEAESLYRIPESMLKAIAKTESGFNPKALGKNTNGTEDIGLMQINSSWLPSLAKFGISRADLAEPCVNLKVGAWILATNTHRYGWSWDAIGAYNVGCRKLDAQECNRRRMVYAHKVYRALAKNQPAATVQKVERAPIVRISLEDDHEG